jgi:hypothetical protein
MMYRYIMQRTQISLTAEDRRLLDVESARTGRSISALIREAVARAYGSERSAEDDLRAFEGALGAWRGREADGEEYVEGLRSGARWTIDDAREEGVR